MISQSIVEPTRKPTSPRSAIAWSSRAPSTTMCRFFASTGRTGPCWLPSSDTPVTAPSWMATNSAEITPASPRSSSRHATRAPRRCSSPAAVPIRTRSRGGRSSWRHATAKHWPQAATEVLAGPLRPVSGAFESTYEETALAFAPLPSRESIEQDAKSSNFFTASRAKLLLRTIEERGSLEKTYPYPVQVWKLGELTWVFLGGEVVVDYSLRIKRNLGSSHVWVSAYCNDVMAYIPSKRVLEEGGYEGGGAMLYYGLPASWSPDVEETILSALARRIKAISSVSPAGARQER